MSIRPLPDRIFIRPDLSPEEVGNMEDAPMKVAILALFALLIAAAPAKASKLDNVQGLETICRSDRDIDNDFCVVTIGVVVNLMFQNNTCGHSPTDGAARQAFLNWADKHPEEWNTETLIGVSRAMKAMWPCPPE
jgi:Rap1a immunity proteins